MRTRVRTFLAISGFSPQIGVSTRKTSSRPIWSTRRSPKTGKTYRSIVAVQLSMDFAFRHRPRFASSARSAASRNVGTLASRLRASGSPPRRASRRFSNAASRASASVVSGQPPRPRSRRFPWMVSRWIQLFEPPGAMCRNRVPPSPCRPGSESARTRATVSFPMMPDPLSPRLYQRGILEPKGRARNHKARNPRVSCGYSLLRT